MDIDTYDRTQYCIDKIKITNVREFEEKLKNGILSVTPSKLKFTFNSGNFNVQENTVEIANYFSKPCLIRFLPFETQYFSNKNTFEVNKRLILFVR